VQNVPREFYNEPVKRWQKQFFSRQGAKKAQGFGCPDLYFFGRHCQKRYWSDLGFTSNTQAEMVLNANKCGYKCAQKKAEPFLTPPLLSYRLAFSNDDLYAGLLKINLTIFPHLANGAGELFLFIDHDSIAGRF